MGQKVFDWAKIAARVPQEAKAEFGAFRARHEACKARFVQLLFIDFCNTWGVPTVMSIDTMNSHCACI